MVKWSCGGEKSALKKGPWAHEEDQKLMAYIQQHGHGSWSSLPAKAGLKRCGKSCRLRWNNYLRPDIKRGKFSLQEDQTIIQLHALLGNRWSAIALHLPKRTDNEIKNHWNTHLKKRLTRMGIDPTTHKPLNDAVHAHAANLNHMAQWETARLQAETRLVRESKLRLHINQLSSFSSQPAPTPCLDVLKAWQNSWSSSTLSTQMHSMYATMLSTHDDLKSPTSTLCFPDTIFLNSNSITDSNMSNSGLINESLLLSSTCVNAARENSSMGSLRDDDDIMVVVEAFRSTGYYNNCNNFMEGVHNEDVLAYGFNENSSAQQNLGVFNDGEAGSTNFEEKHYWETILNLVNDFPL